MAKILRSLTAGLLTNTTADVEQVPFAEGDEVEIIKEWDHFWLVKDQSGHFYNLPKDAVQAD